MEWSTKAIEEIYKAKEEDLSLKSRVNQGNRNRFFKERRRNLPLEISLPWKRDWIYQGTVLKSKITGIGNITLKYLIQAARVKKGKV